MCHGRLNCKLEEVKTKSSTLPKEDRPFPTTNSSSGQKTLRHQSHMQITSPFRPLSPSPLTKSLRGITSHYHMSISVPAPPRSRVAPLGTIFIQRNAEFAQCINSAVTLCNAHFSVKRSRPDSSGTGKSLSFRSEGVPFFGGRSGALRDFPGWIRCRTVGTWDLGGLKIWEGVRP